MHTIDGFLDHCIIVIEGHKYIVTKYFYRIDPKEVDGLPKIPAQPIGYADAEKLLEKLGGKDSPESWRGGIKGIDYKVTLTCLDCGEVSNNTYCIW